MATTTILDADGIERDIENPLAPGRAAAASSKPAVLSTEDLAAINALGTLLTTITGAIKAEDAASAGGDSLMVVGAMRQGTPANTSGTDGDYEPLRVAAGLLQAQIGAALPAGNNLVGKVRPLGDEYETVAASQTEQTLGATGATGDYIAGVLVIPATTSPGNVLLLDNATSITIFAGGANSVSNLVPFFIPLGMTSVSGAWKLTTGANVSCIGIGDFT